MVRPQQLAVVVGVSSYPNPDDHLPGVANDVKEMAKLLQSPDGPPVSDLTEDKATKTAIEGKLKNAFSSAKSEDTLFVYLAGHGVVGSSKYYYVPYDGNLSNKKNTCVALADLKKWFSETVCDRTFLFLDFCYSGGIQKRAIARTDKAATPMSAQALKRAVQVEGGRGKFLVTACTSREESYEIDKHGLFTHALLRGFRGEAPLDRNGHLTFFSLYDFVAETVQNYQTITHFTNGEGRAILKYKHETIRTCTQDPPRSEPTPHSDTRVLLTLPVYAGRNCLELLSENGNAVNLEGSNFRWLNVGNTEKRIALTPALGGIRMTSFPYIVHEDSTTTSKEVFIPYGPLSSRFCYRPRGGRPNQPSFVITAPEERVIELHDADANTSIRFLIAEESTSE